MMKSNIIFNQKMLFIQGWQTKNFIPSPLIVLLTEALLDGLMAERNLDRELWEQDRYWLIQEDRTQKSCLIRKLKEEKVFDPLLHPYCGNLFQNSLKCPMMFHLWKKFFPLKKKNNT